MDLIMDALKLSIFIFSKVLVHLSTHWIYYILLFELTCWFIGPEAIIVIVTTRFSPFIEGRQAQLESGDPELEWMEFSILRKIRILTECRDLINDTIRDYYRSSWPLHPATILVIIVIRRLLNYYFTKW